MAGSERIEEREIVESSRRRLVEGPWVEPSPRRVRAYFNGVAVADSRAVMLAFEPRRLPVYWFPVADVRMDLVIPAPAALRDRTPHPLLLTETGRPHGSARAVPDDQPVPVQRDRRLLDDARRAARYRLGLPLPNPGVPQDREPRLLLQREGGHLRGR